MTHRHDPRFQAALEPDQDQIFTAGAELTKLALIRFGETSADIGGPASVISLAEKIQNEDAVRTILQDLGDAVAPWQGRPMDQLTEADMAALELIIQEHLLRLDERRCLFDEPFLAFFIDKGYLEAARAFIFQARDQDGSLSAEEIFQALRNVWIMNSLQLMWDIPLAITPSVYAYSMLYPYTDNYLDDPAVSTSEKMIFNESISRALQGAEQRSEHPASSRVLELIGLIREQYDPARYPQVSASIGLIQAAQTSSLRQDQAARLGLDDLLPMSFFKGGASVLADAFLVKGILNPSEMEFAFLYGSFLQLVDDLQDARSDLAESHQTLFSSQIQEDPLDEPIIRLVDFIRLINEPATEDTPMMLYMKKVIGACSRLMVLDVLGRDPSLVRPTVYDHFEKSCKVRLAFFKELADRYETMKAELSL